MTKNILLSTAALVFSFSSLASASDVQLARYCDCYHFQSVNLPVFARSASGQLLAQYQAAEMQDCIGIQLQQDSQGQILSIQLGALQFPLQEFNPGPLYFGVRKKIAHSMELVNFDPTRGGRLKFHFLTRFDLRQAFQDDFTVAESDRVCRRPKTKEEIRDTLNGPDWQSFEIELRKNEEGQWSLNDQQGRRINEILALMRGTGAFRLGMVTGVTEMRVSDSSLYEELHCLQSH